MYNQNNNEFRNKQNRALQEKRSENIEKTRESQRGAFNKCKESNPDHIRKLNRQAVTLSMYEKWTKMHRIERDPWCLGWTHVTMICFSQLLKDQVVKQLRKFMNLNVKILHKRCSQWQKSLKLFMIAVSVVLNMHVLAVINHGIGHLLESVKQTNILNVPQLCLKHV